MKGRMGSLFPVHEMAATDVEEGRMRACKATTP